MILFSGQIGMYFIQNYMMSSIKKVSKPPLKPTISVVVLSISFNGNYMNTEMQETVYVCA